MVSRRVSRSRKYCSGGSGSGNYRFDKGLSRVIYVSPLLGQLMCCWGSGFKVFLRCFRFYYFKRASRSHSKTGFAKNPDTLLAGSTLGFGPPVGSFLDIFCEKVGPSFLHTFVAFSFPQASGREVEHFIKQ